MVKVEETKQTSLPFIVPPLSLPSSYSLFCTLMPPIIRSPTYSEEEEEEEEGSDDISDTSPPTKRNSTRTNQQQHQQQQSSSSSRKLSITHGANEDDDLSSLGDSDAEGEDDDEEEEEEEDDQDDQDDDMEGGVGDDAAFSAGSEDDEEEDYDELEEAEPVRRASTSTAGATSGVKIKFKLGGGGSTPSAISNVKAASSPGGRWNGGGSNSGSKKSNGKGKARRRDDDASDLSDEASYSDASAGSSASGSGTRLTARQRAKEMGGEHGMELQSLPNLVKGAPKETVKLTDAELALKRSEVSRKRKSQSDKKLEDEKTETINRLLKKQVGRQRSKLSTSTTTNPNNQSGAVDGDEDSKLNPAEALFVPLLPVTTRWISSIKSGEYSEIMAIPQGRKELGGGGIVEAGKGYPGPRPPPKTRRFNKAVVV